MKKFEILTLLVVGLLSCSIFLSCIEMDPLPYLEPEPDLYTEIPLDVANDSLPLPEMPRNPLVGLYKGKCAIHIFENVLGVVKIENDTVPGEFILYSITPQLHGIYKFETNFAKNNYFAHGEVFAQDSFNFEGINHGINFSWSMIKSQMKVRTYSQNIETFTAGFRVRTTICVHNKSS